MSTLLKSQNPAAAERIAQSGRPLPQIGSTVQFHPRKSEIKRGREVAAGIVLARDEENRLLELMIIYEDQDTRTLECPEWNGVDFGWSRVPNDDVLALDAIKDEIAAVRALIVGEYDAPETSIMDMLAGLDDRVEEMRKGVKAFRPEPSGKAAKPAPAVRGRRGVRQAAG